ncbi:PH domain-containing protein [Iamia sp. SCSIO 61187]|uniref:PH domain-containing protein n=1 Tax=Iamia sp. SCSIO 61187 TaxID=2722752 RepID=UPI001C631F95|nr:PH domain-containing protein [Iamia sp. SCSIO 61187]QYG93579.1 PH domain-containing protein [Iamia sp. SCSIO 61187]
MSDPVGAPPPAVPDPVAARRLHPLSPVLDGVRLLPQLVGIVVLGGAGGFLTVPFLVVGALVVAGIRYLAWSRTSYRIEDGSLVVERGLLERTRTVLPLDRVQQVDVQRKLRHQVTGLAVVRIDRAGGGDEAEVVLDAVTRDEAERLRRALRGGAAGAAGGVTGAPTDAGADEPEHVVVALGLRDVAIAGLTGAKLLVVFAALGAVTGTIGEVAGDDSYETAARWVRDGPRPGTLALLVGTVVAVPLWLAVAAGASILADGGFRLARRGDQLRVSRGVLDQREASLAIHRIQVVRVADNPLRRALGLVSVSLQSAGGSGSVEGSSTRVTVPLLRRSEVDALLAEVLPHAPALPELAPAPPAARRRAWVRSIGVALLVAVPIAVLLAPIGRLALVLPVLAVGLGEASYRALGWATVDGSLIARRGAIGREVAVVPVAKAQSSRLRSSPFQRRAGLATLLVDVAGRGRTPAVVDGDGEDLAHLRHAALDTVAARHDEVAVRRRTQAVVGDRPEIPVDATPRRRSRPSGEREA